MNKLSWLLGGPAGYGILSAGEIFSKACSRGGLHVFSNNEIPSLIRGGHNTYRVRVEPDRVHSHIRILNMVAALNKETCFKHEEQLVSGGVIVYDSSKFSISKEELGREDLTLFGVPSKDIIEEAGGTVQMLNMAIVGACFGLLRYDFKLLKQVVSEKFSDKGEGVVEKNIAVAKKAYSLAEKKQKNKNICNNRLKPVEASDRMFVDGVTASALGAVKAGVKFYSAYPMTPASGYLHTLAKKERSKDICVKQTEDEISAIHMALGASFAGARSMTATSGGGFALMNEALSLAGLLEIPLVVAEVQRPGPATGLPTRTGQEDLKFVLNSGHGEFPKVVVAPGDPEEMFYETFRAFNLAEKYQLVVVVLSDKFLGTSSWTYEPFDTEGLQVERGKLFDQGVSEEEVSQLKRYEDTEDGVSPRTVPGVPGGEHVASSDEHNEEGFIREDEENRFKMVNKRNRKLKSAEEEIPKPEVIGPSQADVTFISYGSSKGPIIEAMKILKSKGVTANFLQVKFLSPFPADKVKSVLEKSRFSVVVEANSQGQFSSVLREKTLQESDHQILKYTGRPFYPSEISDSVLEALKR